MYKMIRAGSRYDPVIMVSPPDAGPGTPGATYFELSSLKDGRSAEIRGWRAGQFNQIGHREAILSFGGMADGWGFAECSAFNFPSLEAALSWVKERREGRVGKGGTWFFAYTSFDRLENDSSRARYEEKLALAVTDEDTAIHEAQRLWSARRKEGTYTGWDKNTYPNSPRVFYEIPWPEHAIQPS